MGSSAEALHMQGKRDHHLGPMQEGGNPPSAQSDLLMAKRTVIQGGQQFAISLAVIVIVGILA